MRWRTTWPTLNFADLIFNFSNGLSLIMPPIALARSGDLATLLATICKTRGKPLFTKASRVPPGGQITATAFPTRLAGPFKRGPRPATPKSHLGRYYVTRRRLLAIGCGARAGDKRGRVVHPIN